MTSDSGTPATTASAPLSTDEALALLANARRRRLLIELANRESEAELSVDSAGLERMLFGNQHYTCGSDPDLDQLLISLHHTHLPKLSDAGVIEWDEWADTIEPGPAFGVVVPFIKHLDQHREALPPDWYGETFVDD